MSCAVDLTDDQIRTGTRLGLSEMRIANHEGVNGIELPEGCAVGELDGESGALVFVAQDGTVLGDFADAEIFVLDALNRLRDRTIGFDQARQIMRDVLDTYGAHVYTQAVVSAAAKLA